MTHVDLLWTGGFDSTYRLLELVMVERRDVHPTYVVDADRRSTAQERSAMERILEALDAEDRDARRRVGPLRVLQRHAFDELPAVREGLERLGKVVDIGPQYRWLTNLAAVEQWQGMELGLIARSHEASLQSVVLSRTEDGRFVCVSTWHGDLFRPFAFPLASRTKRDMLEAAHRHGFAHLLRLAWTCHRPIRRTRDRDPLECGVCVPCRIAVAEGLRQRPSVARRARGRLQHACAMVRRRRQQRARRGGA